MGIAEVRRGVQERFNAELQRRLASSVWNSGGCASWYLDREGRNTTMWPGFTWTYDLMMRRFDASSYELRPRPGEAGREMGIERAWKVSSPAPPAA